MLEKIPRWVQALIVLVLIGVGVLVWQAAPDSEPAADITPATPTTTTQMQPIEPTVPDTIPTAEHTCRECEETLCSDEDVCCNLGCCGCGDDEPVGVSGSDTTSACCRSALADIVPALDSFISRYASQIGENARINAESARDLLVDGDRAGAETDLEQAVKDLSGGEESNCDTTTVCGDLFPILQRVVDVPAWACAE